jgi:hypothetical protein
MKIRVDIDELVLSGFDYNDHYSIQSAMEKELTRLFNNDLASNFTHTQKIDTISFTAPFNAPPTAIGVEIAKSITKNVSRKSK